MTAGPVLGLGFSLGLLHALDADHLVAVGTILAAHPSPRRSALVGLVWGLGHASALAAVGVAVIGLHCVVPPALAAWLELGVALMIVVLGAQAVRGGLAERVGHSHAHVHDGRIHRHRHVHAGRAAQHDGLLHGIAHVGARPFLVGLVHGLAGSAALTLLVLGTIRSPLLGLLYLAVFGLGSIGGMTVTSALLALPLALAGARVGMLRERMGVVVGAGGMAFGAVLAIRLVTTPGLFRT